MESEERGAEPTGAGESALAQVEVEEERKEEVGKEDMVPKREETQGEEREENKNKKENKKAQPDKPRKLLHTIALSVHRILSRVQGLAPGLMAAKTGSNIFAQHYHGKLKGLRQKGKMESTTLW